MVFGTLLSTYDSHIHSLILQAFVERLLCAGILLDTGKTAMKKIIVFPLEVNTLIKQVIVS